MFFMGMMALMTIIINGSTTSLLLRWLGMLKISPAKLEMLRLVTKVSQGLLPQV